MENLVINPKFWEGRKVLVTGHTGFKGGWLALWLTELGAKVSGFALPPETEPNLFTILGLDKSIPTTFADINDRKALDAHLRTHEPEIVLHLAAQPLVRRSYSAPVETFATNVLGTVNLLDAIRQSSSVLSVVVVTSDKCYENREWPWGYREGEPMGGHDPYSASKGCTEVATSAMRHSYFSASALNRHPARIASARAGNVIGGGDWSDDRLVPDIVRGCLGSANGVMLRNPGAVRPWQHVLEPLGVYLLLAQGLAQKMPGLDDSWNVGPYASDERRVLEVAQAVVDALGKGRVEVGSNTAEVHEAQLLRLDISKIRQELGWQPALHFEQTIAMTADWYSAWNRGEDLAALSRQQISDYVALLHEQHIRRNRSPLKGSV